MRTDIAWLHVSSQNVTCVVRVFTCLAVGTVSPPVCNVLPCLCIPRPLPCPFPKNEWKFGDFFVVTKVEKFRRSLREIKDISKFKSLDKSLVHEMDKVFSGDIPKLMERAARPGNR